MQHRLTAADFDLSEIISVLIVVFHILNTVYVAQHCVSYKQCGLSCDIRRLFFFPVGNVEIITMSSIDMS